MKKAKQKIDIYCLFIIFEIFYISCPDLIQLLSISSLHYLTACLVHKLSGKSIIKRFVHLFDELIRSDE